MVTALHSSPKVIKSDVLVIGAGLIGSAVAMGLAKQGVHSVSVIDLDLSGEWSSSELNAGGVRATWSQTVNLMASKHSIEYFEKVADEVGYKACGYLWLHRKESWVAALKAREMHVAHDWPVDVLDVKEIQSRVPFIDKTDDLVGGLYGVKDGLVNPNRLKEHYREEAKNLSKNQVKFYDGIWVYGSSEGSAHTTVHTVQFSEPLSSTEKRELLTENPLNMDQASGERISFEAKKIVNCAGAWAPQLAKILGYTCPSKPIRRQISLFHARELDLTSYGMIIDPSGVYFHPEAIYGLSGFATRNEPEGFHFEYDGQAFFEEYIWANLHERSSAFESLKHISGWAGLYEESPDHHAIVGAAEFSEGRSSRIFEAHSFSGHGAMQSYAVGIALSEMILTGRYQTLDLGELSGDRFKKGRSISKETWVI